MGCVYTDIDDGVDDISVDDIRVYGMSPDENIVTSVVSSPHQQFQELLNRMVFPLYQRATETPVENWGPLFDILQLKPKGSISWPIHRGCLIQLERDLGPYRQQSLTGVTGCI